MNTPKQNVPQQKLDDLIARYGEALCHDPHRCEALLRDLCAPEAYPKEISLIRQVQEQGLVQDLLNVKHHGADYKTVEAKWLRILKQDYAIADDAARWTIDTWAKALGVSPQESPTPAKKQAGVIALAAVLLAISGFWLSEQYRQAVKHQQERARQAELQRQKVERQATIDAAYAKLVCGQRVVDSSLEKKKPDFVYSDGTRYYGPMQAGVPLLGDTAPSSPSLTYSRTMIFSNGERYDGEFYNEKRSGCGTYTYADGKTYVGQFANDRFNGIGLLTTINQSRYVGELKNGRCYGEGLLILPDGQLYSGVWKSNRLQGSDQRCGVPDF